MELMKWVRKIGKSIDRMSFVQRHELQDGLDALSDVSKEKWDELKGDMEHQLDDLSSEIDDKVERAMEHFYEDRRFTDAVEEGAVEALNSRKFERALEEALDSEDFAKKIDEAITNADEFSDIDEDLEKLRKKTAEMQRQIAYLLDPGKAYRRQKESHQAKYHKDNLDPQDWKFYESGDEFVCGSCGMVIDGMGEN